MMKIETIPLKKVLKFDKGKNPKDLLRQPLTEEYLPYLEADYFRTGKPSQFALPNGVKVADSDDLIMIFDGSKSGEIFRNITKGIVASTMVKLLFDREKYDSHYIQFFVQYYFLKLNHGTTGSGIPHLNQETFFGLQLPNYKPKQQEIVASELKAKLTSVEQIRQAALHQKEAVEALQGALLREVFPYKEGDELPKGWKWVKLKAVTEFKNGLNYSESDVMPGIKIVGVGSFKKHFYVKEELLGEVSSEIVGTNNFLQDGDLVVVRSNGNPELVGRHIIFRGNFKVTNSGFTIRLRLNTKELYPEFYLLYAKSTPFRVQIKGQGSNISNLSQDKMKKVVLPAPKSTTEQKQITDKFLIKLEKLEELKYQIITQLEAIEALPAAILREVFEFNTTIN